MQMELEQRSKSRASGEFLAFPTSVSWGAEPGGSEVIVALSGIIFPKGKAVDSWGDPLQPWEWGVWHLHHWIRGEIGSFPGDAQNKWNLSLCNAWSRF